MQPLPQLACHLVGVAGAGAPGIFELAIVVIAEDERPDGAPVDRRRRVARHDEFLAVGTRLLPEPLAFTTGTRPERWVVAPAMVAALAWLVAVIEKVLPAGRLPLR